MQPHADIEVLHHGVPASSRGWEHASLLSASKYGPGTVSFAGIKQLCLPRTPRKTQPSVNQKKLTTKI